MSCGKTSCAFAAEKTAARESVSKSVYASRENVKEIKVIRGGAERIGFMIFRWPRVAVNVANSGDVPMTLEYVAFGAATGTRKRSGAAAGVCGVALQSGYGARAVWRKGLQNPVTGRWISKDTPIELDSGLMRTLPLCWEQCNKHNRPVRIGGVGFRVCQPVRAESNFWFWPAAAG